MLKMICLTVALGAAMGSTARAADLDFDGRHARAETAAEGGYRLHAPQGEVRVSAQLIRSETGSVLFDALFGLAQQEMDADRVDAIRDPAFNHGKPVDCECFQTGARWPYVWTRDVSFAADLALSRLDPVRTRQSLRFKLSTARDGHTPGLFVAQDTGSGGSWPISSDRVVWFLGARGLLDDAAFAEQVWQALQATIAQDRQYVFDASTGLYRGETSFLDWREQTYPGWTAQDVRFIGESYALSTNVLQYQALRLAQRLADQHGDARAAQYGQWADALRTQIDARFWREDWGQYLSYLGPAGGRDAQGVGQSLLPVAKVDLLGLSLGVLADVFPMERARRALANYPITPAGSPVVWPQAADQPIYHNRAIWPFVSAYALRAARRLDDAPRIALEVESILRGAALAGSNMENYEMLSQAVHVDDGALSGPVVNSQRQLWSVAGFLAMVREGVFGVEPDGRVQPKLPATLVPMLFGKGDRITLDEGAHRYVLVRPARVDGDLLVAGKIRTQGKDTIVQLVGKHSGAAAPPQPAERFAAPTPAAPKVKAAGNTWKIDVPAGHVLWRDGVAQAAEVRQLTMPPDIAACVRLTRGSGALASLPSEETCMGALTWQAGENNWHWKPLYPGYWRARLRYENPRGPINTGVTAAVKQVVIRCEGHPEQRQPVVMPHSVGLQSSTLFEFGAGNGPCDITLEEGFNMSALAHFAHYTGGQGGRDGVVNEAHVIGITLMAVPKMAEEVR